MESRTGLLLVKSEDGPIWLNPTRPGGSPDAQGDSLALAALERLLVPVLGSCADEIAARLVAEFGDLERLVTASRAALLSVPGVTTSVADLIQATQDVRTSIAASKLCERTKVLNFTAAATILRDLVPDVTARWVALLLLDGNDRLTRPPVVWMGGLDETPLYPREIARQALANGARSVVIAIGLPDAEPKLSVRDQETLRQTNAALTTIEVSLHDAILAASGNVQSAARDIWT